MKALLLALKNYIKKQTYTYKLFKVREFKFWH